MGKTIGVNNIPEDIKADLKERGYNVVEDTTSGYVDTILYNSDAGSISYLNVFDNVIDMNNGAFIVDVKNRSIDEITDIIENRSYTSLF